MKVLVTGATGTVGRRTVRLLLARGDQVSALTRSAAKARERLPGVSVVEGDPGAPGPWQEAVRSADGVVHLAGEAVLCRWDDEGRKKIRDSRVLSTKYVAEAVGSGKVLVSASAEAFYGRHGDALLDESAPAGSGFLAEVCAAWEQACEPARKAGARVANARIGVVLDPEGGALAQMLPPFKMFMGGKAGSGKQWWSWIHRDDLARLLLFALDAQAMSGPFNAVAPEPATAAEFAKTLGRVLSRPSFLPLPAFALKLRFGESASIILEGARLAPKKALEAGFKFEHPSLEGALRELVNPR